jgi:hypothetical protein
MRFTQLSIAFVAFASLSTAAPLATDTANVQAYSRYVHEKAVAKKRTEQAYGRHVDETAATEKRAEQAYGRLVNIAATQTYGRDSDEVAKVDNV